MNETSSPCPVCSSATFLLDVVDLNKSCEEPKGKFLQLAGVPVYYALCPDCGFCFAPELSAWSLEQFESSIYNDGYMGIDPDYLETRPRANAANLISMFGHRAQAIRHLDYGGGNGLLVNILNEARWQSVSYDPFVDRNLDISQLGTFDLITAFEVFEHVPDIRSLMSNLRSLLSPNGLVLFSTLLSDGHIHARQRLSWWYASPRNGHISLFSKKSLEQLAGQNAVNIASFSAGFHVMFTNIPPWASHIVRIG